MLTEPELKEPSPEVPKTAPKVPVAPAPLPENVPVPHGKANLDDQSSTPRRLDTISGSPSWIFTPPPLTKLDPPSLAGRDMVRK